MLYNISATTHMQMSIDVIEALSRHPQVVGIKDSDGGLPRLAELLRRLGGRPGFSILTGVTSQSAQALSMGADGTVPSIGNLVPALCQQLYESVSGEDMALAHSCQEDLDRLDGLLRAGHTLAQSIGLLKAAMGALDLCGPGVLPPLPTPAPAQRERVRGLFLRWLRGREG
jgi:4-hydroxy-tetrahydrodipicolinate synthase